MFCDMHVSAYLSSNIRTYKTSVNSVYANVIFLLKIILSSTPTCYLLPKEKKVSFFDSVRLGSVRDLWQYVHRGCPFTEQPTRSSFLYLCYCEGINSLLFLHSIAFAGLLFFLRLRQFWKTQRKEVSLALQRREAL